MRKLPLRSSGWSKEITTSQNKRLKIIHRSRPNEIFQSDLGALVHPLEAVLLLQTISRPDVADLLLLAVVLVQSLPHAGHLAKQKKPQ